MHRTNHQNKKTKFKEDLLAVQTASNRQTAVRLILHRRRQRHDCERETRAQMSRAFGAKKDLAAAVAATRQA